MTSSLWGITGGAVEVALRYKFYLSCGNCPVKSHLAVHLKSMHIFIDPTIIFFRKYYISGVNYMFPSGSEDIFLTNIKLRLKGL